jgi:hypothetical protein
VPLRTETGEIYNPRDRYPAGFTPRFAGEVIDAAFTGGIRGEFKNGMSYDFGGRWGENTIKYTIYNTLNHSLGPDTPTSFRPGDVISDESALNADFVLPVDVGFASDLNVAFGLEYRDEGYEVVAQGKTAEALAVSFRAPSLTRPACAIRVTPFTTSAWSARTVSRAIGRWTRRTMAGTAGRAISISRQTLPTASWHRSRADTKISPTSVRISAGERRLA